MTSQMANKPCYDHDLSLAGLIGPIGLAGVGNLECLV